MVQSDKYYLIYDGDCGFCNFWVQWVLRNDKNKRIMFASLQSAFGQRFLDERNLDVKNFNTVYLWKPGQFYHLKSRAIFETANIMGGKYSLLSYFRFLPVSLTDFFYDNIAGNRQKLATQKCYLPTDEEKQRFIED